MYDFIVNPHSRSGKGKKIWDEIEVLLKEEEVSYRVWFTKRAGHAATLAAGLSGDGRAHTIVVLGGDGTLNEVANGLLWPERITLGYLPTGSSNDFARSMGIPTEPKAALACVLHPRRFQYVDLGVLSLGGRERKFCVSAGMGFDAVVCEEILTSSLKSVLNRFHLGKLTYTGIALKHIFHRRTEALRIRLDDGKPLQFSEVLFAAAMNQPYEGGGFQFCPEAKGNDGKLDIIVVNKVSRLKILFALPIAMRGWHTHIRGVHIYTCRKASFHAGADMPVHTDGEMCGWHRELTVSAAPKKLRFITR